MATSMLAALRNAMHAGPADDIPDSGDEDVPMGGRPDTQTEENSMSVNQNASAAAILAGITDQAIADAAKEAVAAARAEGKAEGAKETHEKISAALGAEGVKGDGKRMSAALDLIAKSPGMSGEDVAAFVTGNIAEAKAEEDPAASYEASRVTAAGLANPAPAPKAQGRSLNSGDIYASRREQVRKD